MSLYSGGTGIEQDRPHESAVMWEQHTLLEAPSLDQSSLVATVRAVTAYFKMGRKQKEHSGKTETALHPVFDRLLCFPTKLTIEPCLSSELQLPSP